MRNRPLFYIVCIIFMMSCRDGAHDKQTNQDSLTQVQDRHAEDILKTRECENEEIDQDISDQAYAAKMAQQYMDGALESLGQAYEWAKKADKKTKAQIIEKLRQMDFPVEVPKVNRKRLKKNEEIYYSDQAYAAKMALQYVNGARTYENHKKAYEWALKADERTKVQVIEKLKQMDFPIEISDIQKGKQEESAQESSDQAYAAKMALQYVNGPRTYENHKKAYEWALKADERTKVQVIEKLKQMDFPIEIPDIQESKQEEKESAQESSDQTYAAKKALEYVNGARTYENHSKAYEWALKADDKTKAQVIKRLQELDYPIP